MCIATRTSYSPVGPSVFLCRLFLFQDFVFINKTSKQLFHFLFLGAPNLRGPGAGAPCALCMVNPLLPLRDI